MDEQRQRDEEFMRRALGLARAAEGFASPNPMVGCVLVRDGVVLGEGAHRYDERDHAEIVALKDAAARGRAVPGAMAYVTLEPCSHHGRTGPCADALITAGAARVVVATVDPNPQVRGCGIARLRAAGVEVAVGLCEREARTLNDGFARWVLTGRPLVTLKAATSADGMLAPAADKRVPGQPFWLTGTEARAEVQRMRHRSDAVLTGIGTVLADDPQLTDRSGLPRRRALLRVVLDSQLRTPLASQLVRSAASDFVVFHAEDAPAQRVLALQACGVETQSMACVDGRVDLPAVLDTLGRRGVLELLLECGSALNGSFLRADLVDRVVLFHAQKELGADAVPFAEGVESPVALEQMLACLDRRHFGVDACVVGSLHDAWKGIGSAGASDGLG